MLSVEFCGTKNRRTAEPQNRRIENLQLPALFALFVVNKLVTSQHSNIQTCNLQLSAPFALFAVNNPNRQSQIVNPKSLRPLRSLR